MRRSSLRRTWSPALSCTVALAALLGLAPPSMAQQSIDRSVADPVRSAATSAALLARQPVQVARAGSQSKVSGEARDRVSGLEGKSIDTGAAPSGTDPGFPRWIESENEAQADADEESELAASPILTTVSATLVVLGLFAALVWIARRYGPATAAGGSLPEDVLQHLGSTAIDAKTRVAFLRCADRVLVVGQSATGDPRTLAEITDPDEVSRVIGRCQGRPQIVGRRASSATARSSVSARDVAVG